MLGTFCGGWAHKTNKLLTNGHGVFFFTQIILHKYARYFFCAIFERKFPSKRLWCLSRIQTILHMMEAPIQPPQIYMI